MENTKLMQIKLKAIKRTNKTTGCEFLSYSTIAEDGKRYDVRFKKTVTDIPKKSCVIYVKIENLSYDVRAQYPRIWVSAIEFTKDYETLNGELLEKLFTEVN